MVKTKIPYEPPAITDPFSSGKANFLPVMGQTDCLVGDNASGNCLPGNSPTCSRGDGATGACNEGFYPGTTCGPGTSPPTCSDGTNAQGICTNGIEPYITP